MSSDRERGKAVRTIELQDGQIMRRRLGRALLRVEDGADKGKEVDVNGTHLTGGRSAVNHLQLTDGSVSATHFELRLGEDGLLLRDLGSTNGTRIGGTRIREAWIEPGATFHAGRCAIRIVSADEVDVPMSVRDHFGDMHGVSETMREAFAVLERVAVTPIDVLLLGETGTGKEVAARGLHARSSRRAGPFIVFDCASLPRELAEASVLGYRKGAFTGAHEDTPGYFEHADGGTLFIDEIGELPLDLQPKLLRVLDRREVQRIGEPRPRAVDVRVVAATHRDIRHMVAENEFREDLYFRLSGVIVELPPLRERADDVVVIANRFVTMFSAERGEAVQLGDDALEALRRHNWPGNVRELSKAIRRAVHLAPTTTIAAGDLDLGSRVSKEAAELDALFALPLEAATQGFEAVYLARLIQQTGGNISEAARRAGRTRQWLRELLKSRGVYGHS